MYTSIKPEDLAADILHHLRTTVVAGMPLVGSQDEEITLSSDDITEAIGHCSSGSLMLVSPPKPSAPPAQRIMHYLPEFSDFEGILERDKNATVTRKGPNSPASPEQASQPKAAQTETSQGGSAQSLGQNNEPTVFDSQAGWLQFQLDETKDKWMPVVPPETTVIIESGQGVRRFITFANKNEPFRKRRKCAHQPSECWFAKFRLSVRRRQGLPSLFLQPKVPIWLQR